MAYCRRPIAAYITNQPKPPSSCGGFCFTITIMERQEEIRQLRLKKIEDMRAQNLEAYPGAAVLRTPIKDVLVRFAALVRSKDPVRFSGRVTSTRGHGGILFLDVEDESGIMQVIVRRD